MTYRAKDELTTPYGISPHGANVLKRVFEGLGDGEYDPDAIEADWKKAALEDSIAKENVAVSKAETSIDKAEAGSKNPYLADDEDLANLSQHYSVEELHEIELTDPDFSNRIVNALVHQEKAEKAAEKRVAKAASIADEAKANAEYLHGEAVQNFRSRYWSMSKSEREAEASEFGINLDDYEPPDHPYGATAAAYEGGDDS